jgi:Zn-dependent protease
MSFVPNTELLGVWIIRGIVMMTCLPVHELAHAYVADRLGDPTARGQGRLTLNPFAHLDLFGSLLLIFAGIGWAKPVPVNPGRFKNPKWGMAACAAAGPLSNILLATIFMGALKYIVYAYSWPFPTWYETARYALGIMIWVNLSLAVFNLLPVPPLDGSRIFSAILPDHLYFKIMRYERFIMIGTIALVYLGVLNGVLMFLVSHLLNFVDYITGPLPFY